MLCDASDATLYYASLTSAGSGTWDMTIPADLAEGSYMLKVFSEQQNGNGETDYASAMVSIPLTVSNTVPNVVTITVSPEAGGTVTGAGEYTADAAVTLAAAPNAGYRFKEWQVVSGGVTVENNRFAMPAGAVEIKAVFERLYAIATDGAAQAYYYDGSFNQIFPTEAAEGMEFSLMLSDSAVPEAGHYFTGEFWYVATGTEDEPVSLGSVTESGWTSPVTVFTMRDYDVTIGAVQARRETLALTFAPGETRALPMDAWMQLQFYETAEGEPPLIRYDEATETEALDVNRDGLPDLRIAFDDAAYCVNLTRLADCATVGEFAFSFSGPTDHYSTIAFIIPPAFGTPDFTLPAALTAVEAEAFEGIAASVVDVPESCTSIGDRAFSSCPNLTQIRIPANCILGEDVFDGCAMVVVFGAAGSSAEAYCNIHDNCVFVAVSAN